MAERYGRNLIRMLIGAALCAALATCTVVPVPGDLPAVALGQASLYRLEIALFVFYGALLLITPAFSGLIRGRLPIEISTSGARFTEENERSTELDEAAIERLEATIADLAQDLAETQIETKRLSEIAGRDSRRQGVNSDHD
ncbi:MAG TPA: hypothetical protein VFZ19_06315 [Solirubrobacterales bacterium]